MSVDGWSEEEFCRLTTRGRTSGLARTVELWFAVHDGRFYVMAGGKGGWVYNVEAEPEVSVEVRGRSLEGLAELVSDPDEDQRVRRLLAAKYQSWQPGRRLSSWARTAIPVAVRFPTAATPGSRRPSRG
jgi:deazaflavin-dependent oxidoreductase (nitroreductase family)